MPRSAWVASTFISIPAFSLCCSRYDTGLEGNLPQARGVHAGHKCKLHACCLRPLPHQLVMPVHERILQVFEMLDEDMRERSEAAPAAPKIVERQWRQVHVDLSLADDSPTALDRAE